MPRSLNPWALLIPIVGLLTFLACYYFFTKFGNQTIEGITATKTDASAYLEARIRMQWFAATVAYTFLVAVAVGSLAVDLFSHKTQTDGTRAWRYDLPLRVIVSVCFVLSGIVYYLIIHADDDRMFLYLGANLFETVFEICGTTNDCFGPTSAIETFNGMISYGAVMGITSVTACILGSLLSLARGDDAPYTHAEVSHAKYYLYISSALLSFGILAMMAWMRLPLSVIEGEAAQTLYSDHVKSVILYWGVAFSVVILSYNLPTMAVLRLSGEAVSMRFPGSAEGSETRELSRSQAAPAVTLREVVTASIAFLTPTILPLSVELGGNLLSFIGGGSGN